MSARAGEVPSVSRSAESGLTLRQAGYFFDNSERTCVIQRLSRARREGTQHRGTENAEVKKPQMNTDGH